MNCGDILVRAFPVVLSVWLLQIYISHPSLVMYPFATPPIKLKLGQQIDGELLTANHLDQSLWWANQKHWAVVRSYLLHSFLQVHSAAAPFTSHGNVQHLCWAKTIFLSQTGDALILIHKLLQTSLWGDTLIGLTHLRHAKIGVEASTLCPQTTLCGAKLHQFYVTWPQ